MLPVSQQDLTESTPRYWHLHWIFPKCTLPMAVKGMCKGCSWVVRHYSKHDLTFFLSLQSVQFNSVTWLHWGLPSSRTLQCCLVVQYHSIL